MDNLPNVFSDSLRRKMWGWGITTVLVTGSLVGVGIYAKNTSTVVSAQAPTPTMEPMPGMPGMTVSPTAMPAMPGMAMPTAAPGNTLPAASGDLDTLIQKMQTMTHSLQGMMWQLDQKSSMLAAPTATPVIPAVDMQAMMAEMQSINQAMDPLLLRIQADLQGTPSAEELAAVRAQVAQINTRIGNLLMQLQSAGGKPVSAVTAAPTMALMPGMGTTSGTDTMPGMSQSQPATGTQDQSQAMMLKLDQMMQKMQGLMQQIQGQSGTNPDMSMASPTPMPGMGNMPSSSTSMPGMSSADPAMSGTMSMMDDMMMMMDNMMMMMDDMMPMDKDMMGMPDM
ncbi:MAG TPA: hypothetical protein VHO48_02405 [Anaerolineaceae bacterium]|nr:hypothetical protein [Anaerolineaceae bacterium]